MTAAVEGIDDTHAHIFDVDVVDPLVVLVDRGQHIAARKRQMTGVKQQGNALARMAHEGIKFSFGLNHGPHMMMVGERHALFGAPLAKCGERAAISLHLVIVELGLGVERTRTVTLYRTTDFAINDAGRIDCLEQLDHRRNARLVGRQVFIGQRA